VCTPAFASGLREPDDLARLVRLDYETLRDGKRVSEWDLWFQTRKLDPVKPASTLRFPLYDQAVGGATQGIGVVMGVLPHVLNHVRDGTLVAPFGEEAAINRGHFFIVIRRDVVGREAVKAFVTWLREEVRSDGPMPWKPSRRTSKSAA
jgi:DNA-binding transcriptional LysR family regulator